MQACVDTELNTWKDSGQTVNRASSGGGEWVGGDRKRRLVCFILYTLVLLYIFYNKVFIYYLPHNRKILRKLMGFNVERPGFESQLPIP